MIAYKASKNARILFVGINPHPGSYRRGVPFSNNKMFWYLLNRAGLLQEAESDLKNDQSLKAIYDRKFLGEYGLNFVNLVDRPTVNVTELKRGRRASRRQARVKNHSDVQAKGGLLHWQDCFQHFLQQPHLRLGLAGGHRWRACLSHALSHSRSSVSPRERVEAIGTSVSD